MESEAARQDANIIDGTRVPVMVCTAQLMSPGHGARSNREPATRVHWPQHERPCLRLPGRENREL